MKFRPGERYSYSNGGYVFLGILIEKLTGMLYRDFIREHVLQAANMHRSGFYAFNDLPENTANGYLEDRRTTNIYQLPYEAAEMGACIPRQMICALFGTACFPTESFPKSSRAYLNTHMRSITQKDMVAASISDSMVVCFRLWGATRGLVLIPGTLWQEKLTINILSNITNGENGIRKIILGHL
jgi:CubicO group peptidase (beta-lactamase class C family)